MRYYVGSRTLKMYFLILKLVLICYPGPQNLNMHIEIPEIITGYHPDLKTLYV
jgi:hypothetical protein